MRGSGESWRKFGKRNSKNGWKAKTHWLCHDPSATARKLREPPVGMTDFAMAQWARHSGRDDRFVGGAGGGALWILL